MRLKEEWIQDTMELLRSIDFKHTDQNTFIGAGDETTWTLDLIVGEDEMEAEHE